MGNYLLLALLMYILSRLVILEGVILLGSWVELLVPLLDYRVIAIGRSKRMFHLHLVVVVGWLLALAVLYLAWFDRQLLGTNVFVAVLRFGV